MVLRYELAVPSSAGLDRSEALWQGDLLVGAVADEYVARGFGEIGGAWASLITPGGEVVPYGGAVGNIVRDQVFLDLPLNLGATIAQRGALFGLRDVHVTFLSVLQSAVVIKATSDHPKRAVAHLKHRGGVGALLRRPPTNFEGAYLQVDDATGSPMYVDAVASRNGTRLSGVDPRLGLGRGSLDVPSTG